MAAAHGLLVALADDFVEFALHAREAAHLLAQLGDDALGLLGAAAPVVHVYRHRLGDALDLARELVDFRREEPDRVRGVAELGYRVALHLRERGGVRALHAHRVEARGARLVLPVALGRHRRRSRLVRVVVVLRGHRFENNT